MHLPSLHDLDLELARRAAAAADANDARQSEKSVQALRADAELLAWVHKTFGVRIPNRRVCPTHSSPADAFCDAYFARAPVMIWKGSRGFAGKSFTLGLLGVTLGCTLKADVTVLGGSGQQSARILEGMTRLWAAPAAPRHLLDGDPGAHLTKFKDGQRIIALTASQNSVRGPHPQALLLDEIDEMSLPILEAAQGQPMDRGAVKARTVMSSTHQNPDGTMTAMLLRAREKGWPIHEWCWKETLEPHGWLTADQVERKRQEISAQMWDTEYDLQEPSSEGRAIDTDAVARLFNPELGTYKGADGELVVLEPRVAGAGYAHGADWARKKDWTVLVTLRIDVRPMRLVAFERLQRRPWPQMVARLDARVRQYGDTMTALHDATGIGDVVAGYLESPVEPFTMVGRGRADLLSEYISAVERDEIVAPLIESMQNEHKYATVDDVYGSGHLPDTIAAAALAYRAARRVVEIPEGAMDVGADTSTEIGNSKVL